MIKQKGFSAIELLLTALTVVFIAALIFANFRDAVIEERRSIAQQALITGVGLQERWYLRLFEYAKNIDQVGGEDAAGENYKLKITQDPCGDTRCFTITAVAINEQEKDMQCERMSVNSLGQRRATSRDNQDTTSECWGDSTS